MKSEPSSGPKRRLRRPDADQIRQWVEVDKLTDSEIARMLGMEVRPFKRLRQRRGVMREGSPALVPKPGLRRPDAEEIRQWVEVDRMEDREIANMLGMEVSTFAKLRQRRGVMRADPETAYYPRISQERLDEIERLLDGGYSYRAIEEMTGTDQRTIARHFPGRGFTKEQSIEASLMSRKLGKL